MALFTIEAMNVIAVKINGLIDNMGEFYCKKCGKIIQPTKKYKDKEGIIQANVDICNNCKSKEISYDTK